MTTRQQVDLTHHLNANVIRGRSVDFPVALEPVSHEGVDGRKLISTRRAVVRQDTGDAIAVVSDRYTLVQHTRILDLVEAAIQPLDVGPVPRGLYVDRDGARMRAIFKFPALAKPVLGRDEICPCLQVRNTYDGSARIAVHIGAFRFVCTNLAVGGGGAFAGGYVSIHAGEIPIEKMADQLADYLTRFDQRLLETINYTSLKKHPSSTQKPFRGGPIAVKEARVNPSLLHEFQLAQTITSDFCSVPRRRRKILAFHGAWPR